MKVQTTNKVTINSNGLCFNTDTAVAQLGMFTDGEAYLHVTLSVMVLMLILLKTS